MNFQTYLNQAWNDYVEQSQKVASEFAGAEPLLETDEQIAQFSALITHVLGEHLGDWQAGVERFEKLKLHPKLASGGEGERAIQRSIAVMKIIGGQPANLDSFSKSDQVRILATAGAAMAERNGTKAADLLKSSLDIARLGFEKSDPAHRALAVTGNNLACALEETKARTPEQTALMILAAQTARKYWELCGTWLEVSIAEYRLAMTYLKAGELDKALRHAQLGIEIKEQNQAGHRPKFYGFEALALVEKQRQNKIGFDTAVRIAKEHFANLNADDQAMCAPSLEQLVW